MCCCGAVHPGEDRNLTCAACGYATSDDRPWGLVELHASGRCRQCGKRISATAHRSYTPKLAARCEACETVTQLSACYASKMDTTHGVYRGVDLWLRADVAGHVLWAFDPIHLDRLEEYVAAKHRERTPNHNSSMASRLPRWMKQASHRDEVLAGIARLRATLPRD